MSRIKDFLKAQAQALVDASRPRWTKIGRLASGFKPHKPLNGYRLARTGKHRNSKTTLRHNPAGTKLWKKCPEQRPNDPTFEERYLGQLYDKEAA